MKRLAACALLLLAATAAACDDNVGDTIGRGSRQNQEDTASPAASAPTAEDPEPVSDDSDYLNALSGPVKTNSPEGKAFYTSKVHPLLVQKCGACHTTAGPGPAWLAPADAERTYGQLFALGYVVENSRIVAKGPHGGSSTNFLSTTETQTFNQWVSLELRDGGTKATPNVLATLGACFDRAKFDAMRLGDWRTIRRRDEKANECTGCDNSPCSTCHSADPATGFINAIGNPIFSDQPNYTFDQSKSALPPYITKYFGVSPEGKATASGAIKKKSNSTRQAAAYQHPMFQLTTGQQNALDAFVNDAVTRFNAGTCGR